MTVLLLVPFVLAAVAQVLALIVLPGEGRDHGLSTAIAAIPTLLYALAAVACGAAVAVAAHSQFSSGGARAGWRVALAVVAAVLVCAGPLLWGRAIGEFHLSHHLVRAGLMVLALVLYCWHVSLNR
ncbi:hypothetical protein GCM10028820_00380 [Tessaracoccus terricola]